MLYRLLKAFAVLLVASRLQASQPFVTTNYSFLNYHYFPITTASTGVDLPLTSVFQIPGFASTNQVWVYTSVAGGFGIQLLPASAPQTVANFLAYVKKGSYENLLIHRSIPGFVIQTGGYVDDATLDPISTLPPVASEYKLSNLQGTVAMALVGTNSNSATSQWFVNLTNNSSILDNTNTNNNPPFTVFGQVVGNIASNAVGNIAALPTYSEIANSPNYQLGRYVYFSSNSPFYDMPLSGIATNTTSLALADLVTVQWIATAANPYHSFSDNPSAFQVINNSGNLKIKFIGYPTNSAANLTLITLYASDNTGLSTNILFGVYPNPQGSQTITFPQITQQVYTQGGTNSFTIPSYPTSSAGVPILLTIKSGPIQVTTNQLKTTGITTETHFTLTGTGTVVLQADSQRGNLNSNDFTDLNFSPAAPVTKSFVIKPYGQTFLSFSQPLPCTFGVTQPFLYTPPTSSLAYQGLTNVILTVASGPATISKGNLVTLTGAGTVTLLATQPGNATVAELQQTMSFTVAQGPQTITFPKITNQSLPLSSLSLAATSTSKLPVSFSLISNSPATLTNGGTLHIKGPGTVTVVASQAGNSNYVAATPITNNFIAASNQTISAFASLPNKTYATNLAPISIAPLPTASSRLPVTITVQSGPASLGSNNLLTVTGAGTVTLAANQSGNTNFFAAPQITKSFVVSKAAQLIAPCTGIPVKLSNGISFTVSTPSSSSGLTNTLCISGAGGLSNNTVIPTNVGSMTLTATNAGNSNYLPASLSTNLTVNKGSQTITFPSINSPLMAGTNHYGLSATASSGLPVTYTLAPLKANVSLVSNAIVVNAYTSSNVPTYTVVATQAGNSAWNPATPVTNTFSTMPYDSGGSGGSIMVNGVSNNSYIGSGSIGSGNLTVSSNSVISNTTPTPTSSNTLSLGSGSLTYTGTNSYAGSTSTNTIPGSTPSLPTGGVIFATPTPTPSPTP